MRGTSTRVSNAFTAAAWRRIRISRSNNSRAGVRGAVRCSLGAATGTIAVDVDVGGGFGAPAP